MPSKFLKTAKHLLYMFVSGLTIFFLIIRLHVFGFVEDLTFGLVYSTYFLFFSYYNLSKFKGKYSTIVIAIRILFVCFILTYGGFRFSRLFIMRFLVLIGVLSEKNCLPSNVKDAVDIFLVLVPI